MAAEPYQAIVTWVTDGDTFWVKSSEGRRFKVRIAGIDAPEICQAGGAASRDALKGRALGQTVTLVIPKSRGHDDYGRVLARVELNGDDLGRWMVSQGQAWSYGDRRDSGPYVAEQKAALSLERGLFSQPGAQRPRSFRKRHGNCFVEDRTTS